MSRLRRFAPAALLATAAVATAATPPQRDMPLRAPLASLPDTIAGYAGIDDTLPRAELEVLQHPQYLMRTYRQGEVVGVTAFVGYYSSHERRDGYHSPQECLPGAGWEPLETRIVHVPTPAGPAPVNRYLVGRGAQRALVFYWFQGRGRITADEYATKFHLLKDAMLVRRTDEAFVRLVVPMPNASPGVMGERPLSDPTVADSLGRAAIASLVPALQGALPAPGA